MDDRYRRVLEELGRLIHAKRTADGKTWQHAHENMGRYLNALGLDTILPKLSVVHVAGTKGKGSTCCMVENILRCSGYTTGLFTSPHLCDVRERIRINGQLVPKDVFLDKYEETKAKLSGIVTEEVPMPGYFRFMTLLGLKIFADLGVEVVVLEVGLGGRLDATNVVPKPVVCGITSLGFDHMEILGNTLREIAGEKAGIFKRDCPAFTVPQEGEAMESLEHHAKNVGIALTVAQPISSYRNVDDVKGDGLKGDFQRVNASLAVSLAKTWEENVRDSRHLEKSKERLDLLDRGILPEAYLKGLMEFEWPGRAQIINDAESDSVNENQPLRMSNLTFYLDGAHTPESMEASACWFSKAIVDKRGPNFLLFHCMQERDPRPLLNSLTSTLHRQGVHVHHGIFTPIDSSKKSLVVKANRGENIDLSMQQEHLKVWKEVRRNNGMGVDAKYGDNVLGGFQGVGSVAQSLGGALNSLRQFAGRNARSDVQVLVTGSLYLVGDMLKLLGRMPK